MAPSRDDVEEQLRRILASPSFAGSDRLRDLLTFLVHESLDGRELKDVVIGVGVFGRADFDPKESSLVRSAANRLRKALRRYYEGDGRDAPVRISVPEGGYVPRFQWNLEVSRRAPAPAEPAGPPAASAAPTRRFRRPLTMSMGALIAAIMGALIGHMFSRPPRAFEIEQITRDGAEKLGPLLLDRGKIYFRGAEPGGGFLASVPAAGGDATRVALPLSDPFILDVSPRPPLILSGLDANLDRHVWSWTPGGPPEKLEPHDWERALRVGPHVFVDPRIRGLRIRAMGRPDRWVRTEAWVATPAWLPGRNLLRMDLIDQSTQTTWIAEMDGLEGIPRRMEGFPENAHGGHWNSNGEFYAFTVSENEGQSDIWLSDERGPARRVVRLTSGGAAFESPVPSEDGSRVYAIGMTEVVDLVVYDSQAGGFRPLFGGVSGYETDYSPDRKWVAYVHYPDRTLWKMRRDGSQRVQLTSAPMHAVEPHWSPDGKTIAFMGWRTGRRRRVYLISADGSALREASATTPDQGVPTWSPDGRQIVFGEPLIGDPVQNMQVHLIDLDKRTASRLPSPGGLWTPRWSPDGRWIAALTVDGRELIVYDVNSRSWTHLAHFTNVACPAWTPDSHSIYVRAKREGDHFWIVRVDVDTARVTDVADITTVLGRPDIGWLGTTPEGAPLALRQLQRRDLYSITLKP